LILDLDDEAVEIYRRAYKRLSAILNRPKIMLTTYFGGLEDNTGLAVNLRTEGIHLDLVRDPYQLDHVLREINSHQILSLGVVNGRNVWRTDLDKALTILEKAAANIGQERIEVAPSCSLLHVPIDLDAETALNPEIKEWLAFGVQKLREVAVLTRGLNEGRPSIQVELDESNEIVKKRLKAQSTNLTDVHERVSHIDKTMISRLNNFEE